jgi:hypothetical protein
MPPAHPRLIGILARILARIKGAWMDSSPQYLPQGIFGNYCTESFNSRQNITPAGSSIPFN